MTDDLAAELLPILGRSLERSFNVFDVMHHGTHEKQIANVFGWLLDVGGTHNLRDRFLRIFIDEVNAASSGSPIPHEKYRVRQEVNTGLVGDQADIADLVLEGPSAVLVVENYFTSDGHGHSYEGYTWRSAVAKASREPSCCCAVTRTGLDSPWGGRTRWS